MSYVITGLDPKPFAHLFAMSDSELAALHARRVIADEPEYPCRVSVAHAAIGEELLLLSHQHQAGQSPYAASGPIFVRRLATEKFIGRDQIPEVLRTRKLSVRAYNGHDDIIDAEVCEGNDVEVLLQRMFSTNAVAYIHIHFARRGCYACRVDRGGD